METTSRRVSVVAATGRVGSLLTAYAIEAGHEVTAIARSGERLDALHERVAERLGRSSVSRLRTREADVLDAGAVRDALRGCDVVLSALAAPSLDQPGRTLSLGMRHIVAALEADAPAARVIAIAGGGVLDAPDGGLQLERPEFPDLYRAMSREHAAALDALRQSSLAWVLVCPADMPSGERTGRYRTEPGRMPEDGSMVSAEDVADFIIREAGERRYDRVRVGICY
jgi:uncharacterized protein